MEPIKGLKQTQVIRAVADKGKRPEIPRGASVSPDAVRLMKQCWKQHPADRPEGFRLVARNLASVVSRDGDPRTHSAAAVGATPPSPPTPTNQGWRVPGFLPFMERRLLGDGGFEMERTGEEVVERPLGDGGLEMAGVEAGVEAVERPLGNGQKAAPRFRFQVSQSDFLVISEDDANAVLDLANKTGFGKREPADVSPDRVVYQVMFFLLFSISSFFLSFPSAPFS